MSNEIPYINDRRGILFTINSDSNPVYQVESKSWAHEVNRWTQDDIPQEIRDKVADLKETGKPGAFVRFLQGEVGVYVIYEKNIKNLPEAADEDLLIEPRAQPGSERELAPYDIVICTKDGTIHTEDGETVATREGDYYIIRCQTWGRFVLNPPMRPSFVETTKEFLLLLDDLHGRNFLSMSPDITGEVLPGDIGDPVSVADGVNCYVLNLARFKR